MPATSPASLALAARLRELDDDGLADLIRLRGLSVAGLHDLFDLAESLLDTAAVSAGLADLPRHTLAALALSPEADGVPLVEVASRMLVDEERLRSTLQPAVDRALVVLDGDLVLVMPPVTRELAAWPRHELPDAESLRDERAPASLRPVDVDELALIDRAAAERAFGTTTRVSELTRALGDAPARLLARGGLSLPDARRLAESATVDLDDVVDHLELARAAALIVDDSSRVRTTVAVDAWRTRAVAERWARLAEAWATTLPSELRTVLGERVSAGAGSGTGVGDLVEWLYPAASDTLRDQLADRAREAELLGITVDARVSSLGLALLAHDGAAAEAALRPLLPPEVTQVYLQHDLTIVSPGPLAAALDDQLRGMAELESAGLAGRYRLTAESVSRAVAQGSTAVDLLEFLRTLSLTGVPQPAEYLIQETAARYGAVRVGTLSHDEAAELGAVTSVRSDDTVLLQSMLVDSTVSPLSLRRVGPHRLVSRFDLGLVLWTLVDARYPAAPEEGEHPPQRPAPRSRGRVPTTPVPTADPVREAVRRLRSAASTNAVVGDAAWVARQWELAMRSKLTVRVTVSLPDGSERDFDLEPTGIAAGRVRGRDLTADVERTLPIASISALEPVE